jgi:hypothetical protein
MQKSVRVLGLRTQVNSTYASDHLERGGVVGVAKETSLRIDNVDDTSVGEEVVVGLLSLSVRL